ncbi:MAG: TetR/AcrR family transcriptional regulator [Acidobacteriia bacterium]|nr:TetR/AcrR family transcriptional regulator [Terriglobia bacterium]
MSEPAPYHHGHLKQALLKAAVRVIGKVGPRAFTLREVARQAKVSHNAPYRHFRDKEELLAAVAAEGFERLARSMIAAAKPAENALDALAMSGRGYVQFALRWPEHFSAMFDYCEGLRVYPEYAASGREAFQVLVDYVTAAQKAGQLPAVDTSALALTAWSMVHGIAKLAIGRLLPAESKEAVFEFTAFATRALSEGLTNLSPSGGLRRSALP